jgi:hypothetical protein
VDAEIEKLVENLTEANAVLIQFANRKADELNEHKQALMTELGNLTADEIPAAKLTEISGYLNDWSNTSHDAKKQVTDSLISIIRATNENVEII